MLYYTEHHNIDVHPIPRDKTPRFINEPWLIDPSIVGEYISDRTADPEPESDNIRIFVPMDLNAEAILRRLRYVIARYKEADERSESDFRQEVLQIYSQIEIYDQIWYVRHMPKGDEEHSAEAKRLIERFVKELEEIPDGCAETFPFDMIDELREEYGISRISM